ncbi:C39 family peptidase [Kocuria massiliensis]|uniref:C39 family peptidase n=1 Tax=Kocuria massiliensis TaxID=1926282 RepID=UPI0022B9BF2D|nr:C39 family peptidase [Kocuria massiliensis]
MTSIKNKLIAGSAIAFVATGAVAGTATAATAAPQGDDVQVQQTAQKEHKFQYISQVQGQDTQYYDCAQASMLMAILQNGGDLPSKYTDSDQAAAMSQLRDEAGGGTGNIQSSAIPGVLSDHGVDGTEYVGNNASNVIDQIKDGKQAIILTQTGVISGEDANPGYGHFVYVSDYDKDKGTFTVNDPLQKSKKSYQATKDNMDAIINNPAEGNTPWAYAV